MSTMKLSAAGLAAIKKHEGLRLEAYPDPGSANGKPVSIGYGATTTSAGNEWSLGDRITELQAETLLRRDLEDAERTVNALVKVPLSQGQFDSLTSLVFNIGSSAFADSTLLRLLNEGDYIAAEMQFQRWNKNDGAVMPGLTNSRKAEAAMFAGAAPIERKDTMSPFLIAALPALVEAIPGLIRNFGKGEVTERNAKAAEAVLEIVQTATGTTNAQAAVEAVKADPAARVAATEALDKEGWFIVTEAGGGGIEGAREFSLAARGAFWELPAFWITALLMIPVYLVIGAVLFQGNWPDTIRVQVVTAVLAIIGIVGAFWLGTTYRTNSDALTRSR
jgi:lysozyme